MVYVTRKVSVEFSEPLNDVSTPAQSLRRIFFRAIDSPVMAAWRAEARRSELRWIMPDVLKLRMAA